MKKGQVYEGSVVRVDFPNKGIVCVGDETAVVKNSLPGQKVKFSVNKVRKGKAEGRLLEVTEKSPLISTERGLYAPLLKALLPQPPAPSRMTEKSPFIVSDDDEAAPDARS